VGFQRSIFDCFFKVIGPVQWDNGSSVKGNCATYKTLSHTNHGTKWPLALTEMALILAVSLLDAKFS
jgi:hypothetical protein